MDNIFGEYEKDLSMYTDFELQFFNTINKDQSELFKFLKMYLSQISNEKGFKLEPMEIKGDDGQPYMDYVLKKKGLLFSKRVLRSAVYCGWDSNDGSFYTIKTWFNKKHLDKQYVHSKLDGMKKLSSLFKSVDTEFLS